MKIHQLIAIVEGRKTRAKAAITEFYQGFSRDSNHATFSGLIRTYKPFDEADVTGKLPDERKNVQRSAKSELTPVLAALGEAFDTVAAQDTANCSARADVKVGDEVLLKDVPVTTLMWIDKQLTDMRTVIDKLPTLDPAEVWEWDAGNNCYRSKPSETHRSKKVMRNHVKAEATDRHPAQVETFNEDVPIGTYTTVKFSGAIPASEKHEMLNRVNKLIDAVKLARESANQADAYVINGWSKKLLDFVFPPK